MAKQLHYKVVIVGGGTGGITTAARLLRERSDLYSEVAIVDPAEKHYYQPLWTLVGGGEVAKERTERAEASVIPDGAKWIQEAVVELHPDDNVVITASGTELTYDFLVVAPGIQLDWEAVKGLKENLGKNGVCSNYAYEYAESTWDNLRNFKGGTAIFTAPNTPIKCGGAPQKIMYLAEDYFRKTGVRKASKIVFASGGTKIFGVEKYAETLTKIVHERDIATEFFHNLVEIDGQNRKAVFQHLQTGERVSMDYEMIHVVPPMSAPEFIKSSPLADENGWVDVDKHTLQHTKYANVFGVGDATNLPTSKTGAAIRKQAPVLVQNLLAAMRNAPGEATYNGYTSCPVITGYGKLMLAEFDYDNNPAETFPFDQGKERFSMYLLKKDMLPVIYWNGMLKGVM
ncbi:NAD(P)/FAD-dependent oxidoreductase [Alicyclobacillus sp. ALC3]|uniref:NAD(P)/FAD-dependent oxidoreductase n=1 Tax=Alicyclobacillus sp. ALC3 TaxID=2796143 RepID=UPI002378332B|nr:FAD/NAD(P)-binding oxidoreductase [Alicyclobacillus sp. ALC3]WDL95520.1 NAD(P)/FAD-dependent oxidoreductase [Alicyclobacillus sp. ALC3]